MWSMRCPDVLTEWPPSGGEWCGARLSGQLPFRVSSLAVQHLSLIPVVENHPLHIHLVGSSAPPTVSQVHPLTSQGVASDRGDLLGFPTWDVKPVTQK